MYLGQFVFYVVFLWQFDPQKLQLKDILNSDQQRDAPSRFTPDSDRSVLSTSDMRHRDYEIERDRVFAERLQRLGAEHNKRIHEKKIPKIPQPQGSGGNIRTTQPEFSVSDGRNNCDTPPLPVLANGDVLPSAFDEPKGNYLYIL